MSGQLSGERPKGTPRAEPWLSLEDDDQQVRCLIARLAHETWESVCVGNQAPIVAERYRRMTQPRVGDLVVERNAWYYERVGIDHVVKGVGYLIARQNETEPVWYVQYGPEPADVCRWVNADFVAVDLGKLPVI